jgi:geranylgeranyl diphosphate synthase type II
MTPDLASLKESIEHALSHHLPAASEIAPELVDAMRYAVLGGGKRLRPMFTCTATTALGGTLESALPAACAVELVHTYSLVHDDLPAMDDDDLRHGKAATHVVHGEANAILAGDALLTLAFELLTELPGLTAEQRMGCVRTLAGAAGWDGMVGGQVLDMALPERHAEAVDIRRLEALHAAKTGRLIRASVLIGGQIAGADPFVLTRLETFADAVGLAFQVRDDVLDVTGTTAELGKPAGSDVEADKHTFVRLLGVDGANRYADELLQRALDALTGLTLAHDGLQQLAHRAVNRSY